MNDGTKRILVIGDSDQPVSEWAEDARWNQELARAEDAVDAFETLRRMDSVELIVIANDETGELPAKLYRRAGEILETPPDIVVFANDPAAVSTSGIPPFAIDIIPVNTAAAFVRLRIDRLLATRRQRRKLEYRIEKLDGRLERADVVLVETLMRCTAYKDDEFGRHVQRINEYSSLMARLLGMPASYCETIGLASMLHDIGKVSVPDAILQKPGKLDPEEWEVVKQHCTEGASILGDPGDSTLLNMTLRVILCHHEKWDGTGYPAGLSARDIPLEGRIVALADVFDALTTDLPYKKAWGIELATSYIRTQSGMHFDPELVSLFIEHIDKFVAIKTRLADILVEEEVADRR
ncbi:MAG: HD domain-containing protein [Proteobacteria bacterium]|nr:MAG: HD domain-containing protein [Pseudomonadota bacterium]